MRSSCHHHGGDKRKRALGGSMAGAWEMRRLNSVVRLDRGGGPMGGRGVAVGKVRPHGWE